METKRIMLEGNDYKVVFRNGEAESIQHSYWRMANSRPRQITKQIKPGGELFKKIVSIALEKG